MKFLYTLAFVLLLTIYSVPLYFVTILNVITISISGNDITKDSWFKIFIYPFLWLEKRI